MPHPPYRGLAFAASVLAIVVGSAVILGSLLLIALAQSYSSASDVTILAVVLMLLALPGVVLGRIGCRIEPRAILANAIVHSALTVAGLVFVALTRFNTVQAAVLLAYAVTMLGLYLGVAPARRFQAARRAAGA